MLYLGRDESGKKRQKWVGGFRTKREAESALAEALGRVKAGQFSDPGRLTVREFLDQWIDAMGSGLRASTAASYRMLLVKRVMPRIGHLRLAALTPAHLTKLYSVLLAQVGKGGRPLSPRSVRYTHTVLGKALSDAVEWGLLPRNPARSAKAPKPPKPEMAVWEVEQAKCFLAGVSEDRLYALWLLMLTTGLRRAEVAGLRWTDVDLSAGVISVQSTRVAVDFQVVVSEPKTAKGRRSVALDGLTLQALPAHRKAQLEERLRAGDLWHDTAFITRRCLARGCSESGAGRDKACTVNAIVPSGAISLMVASNGQVSMSGTL